MSVASLAGRLIEPIIPVRLGSSFRWLFASSLISNVGDGIALAAGPLLVASQSSDPFVVSLAVFAQVLPPLLFGIVAGAVADRMDRKRIVILVNLVRAMMLGLLAMTVATGTVNVPIILLSLFVLATAETFADVAAGALLPRIVPRADLGIANSRLQGAFLLTNQLVAPPIGAFLFVIGMALPFAADAACFALGAVLVLKVATRSGDAGEDALDADTVASAARANGTAARSSMRTEMADGLRWLIAHPAMRTLA